MYLNKYLRKIKNGKNNKKPIAVTSKFTDEIFETLRYLYPDKKDNPSSTFGLFINEFASKAKNVRELESIIINNASSLNLMYGEEPLNKAIEILKKEIGGKS